MVRDLLCFRFKGIPGSASRSESSSPVSSFTAKIKPFLFSLFNGTSFDHLFKLNILQQSLPLINPIYIRAMMLTAFE